jgi:hypothetical protein
MKARIRSIRTTVFVACLAACYLLAHQRTLSWRAEKFTIAEDAVLLVSKQSIAPLSLTIVSDSCRGDSIAYAHRFEGRNHRQ